MCGSADADCLWWWRAGGSGDSVGTPSIEPYSEPTKDVVQSPKIGFYDVDAKDQVRQIRPDLEGNFQAMVQFGQSYVVEPNGNEAKQILV